VPSIHRLIIVFACLATEGCPQQPTAAAPSSEPAAVDATDAAPAPLVEASVPTVDTSVPLVEASVPTVDASVPKVAKLPCAAQRCEGQGQCDGAFGLGSWMWNGSECAPFYAAGCSLVGPDCGQLGMDRETCALAHAHCKKP
jgi:hypothetical protein